MQVRADIFEPFFSSMLSDWKLDRILPLARKNGCVARYSATTMEWKRAGGVFRLTLVRVESSRSPRFAFGLGNRWKNHFVAGEENDRKYRGHPLNKGVDFAEAGRKLP